jgi:hypothetical protein
LYAERAPTTPMRPSTRAYTTSATTPTCRNARRLGRGSQTCQPAGAGPHRGLGFHPAGGDHPGGGAGQLGGGLYRGTRAH